MSMSLVQHQSQIFSSSARTSLWSHSLSVLWAPWPLTVKYLIASCNTGCCHIGIYCLFNVCPCPEASPWDQDWDLEVRQCETCCAGTVSARDSAASAINRELGNAVCKPQKPTQLPWKDSYTWKVRHLSWAQHLHDLQEWWELGHLCACTSATPVSAGGLGHQAEVTKCLQISARCQQHHQRKGKSLTPILESGMCLGMGLCTTVSGQTTYGFWSPFTL